MKTFKTILVVVSTMILGAGCGHLHKVQGTETPSTIPEGVRVSIGSKEVKEGDKVDVMQSVCKQVNAGPRVGTRNVCHNEKIGEAVVLKVLDHDSAIVQPQQGLTMDSKMRVEKQGEK
jgi:hypothetical protein